MTERSAPRNIPLDSGRKESLRAAALRDHCRSLRPDHRPAVVRRATRVEASPGRRSSVWSRGRGRSISPAARATSPSRSLPRARALWVWTSRRGWWSWRGERGRSHGAVNCRFPRRRHARAAVSRSFVRPRDDGVRHSKRSRPRRRDVGDSPGARPGGLFLSLDFNRPANALVRAVYLTYLTVVGSAVGWALHRDPDTYRYIPESIKRYPGAEAVVAKLAGARLWKRQVPARSGRADGHSRGEGAKYATGHVALVRRGDVYPDAHRRTANDFGD